MSLRVFPNLLTIDTRPETKQGFPPKMMTPIEHLDRPNYRVGSASSLQVSWRRRIVASLAMLAICCGLFPSKAWAGMPAVANDDYGTTSVNSSVDIDILLNDYGMEIYALDPSSIFIHQEPAHGTLSIDYDWGIVTYTPDQGYTGLDEFHYTVCDVYANSSNLAYVDIYVSN